MAFITVGKENSEDINLYYKDWGDWSTGRLQPRLAVEFRRIRRPDALPGLARISMYCP